MVKERTRTIFVICHKTGLYYFCDESMRSELSRLFKREDTDITPERAVALVQELAEFYSVNLTEDTPQWLTPFDVEEPGLLASRGRTLHTLVVQATSQDLPRLKQIIPIRKHPFISKLSLGEIETTCVVV